MRRRIKPYWILIVLSSLRFFAVINSESSIRFRKARCTVSPAAVRANAQTPRTTVESKWPPGGRAHFSAAAFFVFARFALKCDARIVDAKREPISAIGFTLQ